MALRQTQKQSQALFPQMIESMSLLQMGIQELREYLENALQENPVLELPEPGDAPAPAEELSRQLDWLSAYDAQNAHYYVQDAEDVQWDALACEGYYLDEESDLKRYILSQFLDTRLEPFGRRGSQPLRSYQPDTGRPRAGGTGSLHADPLPKSPVGNKLCRP